MSGVQMYGPCGDEEAEQWLSVLSQNKRSTQAGAEKKSLFRVSANTALELGTEDLALQKKKRSSPKRKKVWCSGREDVAKLRDMSYLN